MDIMQTVGAPIPAASVTVAYTAVAGTTAALHANTRVVRVVSTTDCFIEVTLAGTAAVANTGLYLPAFTPEYFIAGSKFKVSAIRVSADGSIYVTPF